MFGEFGKGRPVSLTERMLGGGERLWYQDGSIHGIHNNWEAAKQLPRYDSNNPKQIPYNVKINENKAFKSVPSADSKALAEQVELSKENDWKAKLDNFPNPKPPVDAKTGEQLPIKFRETGADGYTLTVVDPAIDESGKVYSFTLKNSILTSVPVKKVWRDSATASRATDWGRWPCRLVGYSGPLRCRGGGVLIYRRRTSVE